MTKDKTNIEEIKDLEQEELFAFGTYVDHYFWQVLVGEVSLEEIRENILSFRNTEFYTGTNQEYKDKLCMCGGTKLPESNFCKECI